MAHFMVKGKRYTLATLESLTFDEARELKRISGIGIAPIFRALTETDPDAWLGLFVVSMQREDPHATEAALASESVVGLVESVEEDQPIPPVEGPEGPASSEEHAKDAASESPNDSNTASSSSAETVSQNGHTENSSSETTTPATAGGRD